METPSPPVPKYYTHSWTITVPSHPNVRIIRATPAYFDLWVPLIIDPEIREFLDNKDKVWTEEAISEWKTRAQTRYDEAPTSQKALELLLEVDGEVLGYGGLFLAKPGVLNIGLGMRKAARGRGLGKLLVQVMAQIGFDLGNDMVELGTMKFNHAMRGVMASLGVEEREERVVVEGRGLLAELLYDIKKETWKDVEMKVEITETSV